MELLDKIYIGKLIDEYGELLTDKQLNAVNGYFLNDLSLTEIGENEGISRQAAYEVVNKAKSLLISFEEKVGKLKTINAVEKLVEEILQEEKVSASIKNKLNQILEEMGVK